MSINPSWLRMFLEMRNRRGYSGRVLLLGGQDMLLSHKQAEAILKDAGHPVTPIPESERTFKHSKRQKISSPDPRHFMHVKDLFCMMGFDGADTLDAFENDKPELLHNLNDPVPEEWRQNYDLVIDIGVMEHVCDTRQALENVMHLTKVGGEVLLYLPMFAPINATFFTMNPPFYFDLLSANGFDDFSAWLNWFPAIDDSLDVRSLWLQFVYNDEIEPVVKHNHYTQMMFTARRAKDQERFTPALQRHYIRHHASGWDDDETAALAEPADGAATDSQQYLADQDGLIVPIDPPKNFVAAVYRFMFPIWLRQVLYIYRHAIKMGLSAYGQSVLQQRVSRLAQRPQTPAPQEADVAGNDEKDEKPKRKLPPNEDLSIPLIKRYRYWQKMEYKQEKKKYPHREILFL